MLLWLHLYWFCSDFLHQYNLSRASKYLPLNDDYHVTTVPDMYVLGSASHVVDYRKSSGGFIHGFRYTSDNGGHTEITIDNILR